MSDVCITKRDKQIEDLKKTLANIEKGKVIQDDKRLDQITKLNDDVLRWQRLASDMLDLLIESDTRAVEGGHGRKWDLEARYNEMTEENK